VTVLVQGFWLGSAPLCENVLRLMRLRGRRLTAEQEEFLYEMDGIPGGDGCLSDGSEGGATLPRRGATGLGRPRGR
jgi:hypothetical protein